MANLLADESGNIDKLMEYEKRRATYDKWSWR